MQQKRKKIYNIYFAGFFIMQVRGPVIHYLLTTINSAVCRGAKTVTLRYMSSPNKHQV